MTDRHPDKDINASISYALEKDWRLKKGKGHCWARLLCPQNDRTGCQISVWSTPKNAGYHASHIVRMVDKCDCGIEVNDQDL